MTIGRKKMFPILLSGGAGSRLWPLSRESRPKQLLRLTEARTLLQQTALRASDSALFEPLTVIGSVQHRSLIADQLREMGGLSPTIVLEPCARNTAAAAAVAALLVSRAHEDAMLLIMPADHRINDIAGFLAAVDAGTHAAASGMLVLFGMKPHAPATGYGYIHAGEALPGDERVKRVAGFVEKPDRPTAERYLASGEYFWNSGIFLMSAKSLLGELARHEPQILAHAREALGHSWRDGEFLHLGAAAFEGCPSLSIDYAVMERTQRAAVVPADFGWTDVGSWSTLWEMAERDASGNMLLGDVLTERTRNSYIRSEGPLIATIGVEDLIVVATDDAVLIAHKSHDQEIKKIVERLRARDPGRI